MGRLRMVRRLEAGARLCDVAAALDLSTTSVRRWWRRYQAEGIAGLSDRSSRPHHSPRALPRRPAPPDRPAAAVGLEAVLHRGGSSAAAADRRPRAASPWARPLPELPGSAGAPVRARRPGRAGPLGDQGAGPLPPSGAPHSRRSQPAQPRERHGILLHIAIDDRTRLAYAALFPDETAASAAAFLALAHRWFAARGVVIRGLLTDNGSAYSPASGLARSVAGWDSGTPGPGPIGRRPTARRNASSAAVWDNGYSLLESRRPSPKLVLCPISCDTTTRTAFTWASTEPLPCSDSRRTVNNVFINYS